MDIRSGTVYKPDDPAFAEDFIEYSDSWSRAQVRATWASLPTVATSTEGDEAEDALLAQLRPKIVALRLTCSDAEPITDPADLTPRRTEQIDTRLYEWFAQTWVVHLNALTNLGNALGRQLYATSATSSSREPTAATKTKQPTARHRSRKN
jgi:hypothetical protein